MTKKHFEAIARIVSEIGSDAPAIRGVKNINELAIRSVVQKEVASKFASTFKQYNPNFDSARFLKACYPGEPA
jgi:hypothetical protein